MKFTLSLPRTSPYSFGQCKVTAGKDSGYRATCERIDHMSKTHRASSWEKQGHCFQLHGVRMTAELLRLPSPTLGQISPRHASPSLLPSTRAQSSREVQQRRSTRAGSRYDPVGDLPVRLSPAPAKSCRDRASLSTTTWSGLRRTCRSTGGCIDAHVARSYPTQSPSPPSVGWGNDDTPL